MIFEITGLSSILEILGVAAYIVLAFASIYGFVIFLLRRSKAYHLGVSELQNNPLAANFLGTPVKAGIPWVGSISVHYFFFIYGTGSATLRFSVRGPKGAGRVFLNATMKNGLWSITRLSLRPKGRFTQIDLIEPNDLGAAVTRFLRRRGPAMSGRGLLRLWVVVSALWIVFLLWQKWDSDLAHLVFTCAFYRTAVSCGGYGPDQSAPPELLYAATGEVLSFVGRGLFVYLSFCWPWDGVRCLSKEQQMIDSRCCRWGPSDLCCWRGW